MVAGAPAKATALPGARPPPAGESGIEFWVPDSLIDELFREITPRRSFTVEELAHGVWSYIGSWPVYAERLLIPQIRRRLSELLQAREVRMTSDGRLRRLIPRAHKHLP